MGVSVWTTLPTELKLSIIDLLDSSDDVASLSMTDSTTYSLCVPTVFRTVDLSSAGALRDFNRNVPRSYRRYVRRLTIRNEEEARATTHSDDVEELLTDCERLEELRLDLAGSPKCSIVTCMSRLRSLTKLSMRNACDERVAPFSERMAVSMAASVPRLTHLSLDKISRSKMHAPELIGRSVPLVMDDEDVAADTRLGTTLCLPSVMRISTLKSLTLRDCHLGDVRWGTSAVDCRLESLDLGSYHLESDGSNRSWMERIVGAVGGGVRELSVGASVCGEGLRMVQTVHLSAQVPVEELVSTMGGFEGSPVESITVDCYEEDLVDVCETLEEFAATRVENGPSYFSKLKRINLSITANIDDNVLDEEEIEERCETLGKMQDFFHDLSLESRLEFVSAGKVDRPAIKEQPRRASSYLDYTLTDRSSRACTI